MYNSLTTTNSKFRTTPISEIAEKLTNLGYMGFDGATDEILYAIRSEEDVHKFIRIFFYLNSKYPSYRWSHRYQKNVNYGNRNINNINTNRSITDIFLTALNYNPKFANFDLLYEALITWYREDHNFASIICSTINRRVWFYRGINRTLSDVLKSNVPKKLSGINSGLYQYDELGNKILINNDQFKLIKYGQPEPEELSIKFASVTVRPGLRTFIQT